ncbi:MAG: hypothetical protein ACRDQ4_11950 [Pseudonocardiaceae bacterium]
MFLRRIRPPVVRDRLSARRHPQRQAGDHHHILAKFPDPNFIALGQAQPSLLQLATAASTFLGLTRLRWRPYIVRTGSKEVVIASSKTERIEVRGSEWEQEVVHRSRDIRMSAAGYEQFLVELDRPAESVPALRELFSRPREIHFGES